MISLGLDITAFELIPAILIALVGWIAFNCRLQCLHYIAVVVELYRGIVSGLG